VGALTADTIRASISDSDLGTVRTLAVKNLYVGNRRINVEDRFDEIGDTLTDIYIKLAGKVDK